MNEKNNDWFIIKNTDTIDTPALVVYTERVKKNIDVAVAMMENVTMLRPHVKTHKCKEVTRLMMDAGISKFKCATIAEAEMLAMCNATDVLLAYQPNEVKLQRFILLIKKYTATIFSCITDNIASAESIAAAASQHNITIPVYIDINVGMNRTGIAPGQQAIDLYKTIYTKKNTDIAGFHVYDGHLHLLDIELRTEECNEAFAPFEKMIQQLKEDGYSNIKVIAGGSPSFPIHAKTKDVECSPGTFVYWDKGYETLCPEQHFSTAALVLARIISLPAENLICIDLGHKSIAAEKDLQHRVFFLNAPELIFVSQSEEHLVAQTTIAHTYKVDDILYGVPYHICPTVALYERAIIIENNFAKDEWKNIGRDRKLTV